MGMRQNIKLNYEGKNPSIYLYSHWGGGSKYQDSSLAEALAKALDRGRERWGDESYLARIIFSEVVKGDIDGLTGYGLSPYAIDEEFETIEVDLEKSTVDGMGFETFIAIFK